ncbi:NAD-dependent epimerase/dehydratase family protein [Demequina zhanjiangensis]|uniref:NAD(P)-dependent oxidoreductase n=1 Tax=Demequina zhanjiangensis TaxID=3051659 RepID=A0ABT8G3Z1_9MICO|nr:NAD(P)-dependent oxidoreductase [Demequina sp. SYSU T00b26]MDN4473843.1 NAD(P)-dependent oxidoreductase [Demequina sp. SYSU T00b26]
MSAVRRRVLLTGATGNWGRATMREFRHVDDLSVRVLAMPGAEEHLLLEEFADLPHLEIYKGDLTRYADIARAIQGVDVVLHVGAVVSPYADQHPALAHRVNVGSMRNLIQAVQALPDPSATAIVGVGSVAETGDRQEPHHWGRVGDPIRVSRLDEYGQTKVEAERLLVDSGLPRWVWLRQTGIMHPGLLAVRDPIVTHVPLAGVMEWVSDEDAARLLVGIAQHEAPAALWGRVFNVGGGEAWRLTNFGFQERVAAALGVRDVRRWYERNWFATRNFHGHWFSDSDLLEELVPFRRDTVDEALERAVDLLPTNARHAGRVPAWLVKRFVMRPLAYEPRGTMHAVLHRDGAEIAAHFGSLEEWLRIGGWDSFEPPAPSRTPTTLDHGFDETKPAREWTHDDLAGAAAFRGGELLAGLVRVGDVTTRLPWRCGFGHEFKASARLVLAAGHWCPVCVKDTARYAEQAELSPFLAQLERAPERVKPASVGAP